jgi:hypothetical protein
MMTVFIEELSADDAASGVKEKVMSPLSYLVGIKRGL